MILIRSSKTVVRKPSPAVEARKPQPPNKENESTTPQGYMTAFNYFAMDLRKTLQANDSEILRFDNNSINKFIGLTWKLLPADQVEIYSKKSSEDKKRYLDEFDSFTSSSGRLSKKSPRIRHPESCVEDAIKCNAETNKRTRTSYDIFVDCEMSHLRTSEVFTSAHLVRHICAGLSARWKSMSCAEAALYDDLGERELTQPL